MRKPVINLPVIAHKKITNTNIQIHRRTKRFFTISPIFFRNFDVCLFCDSIDVSESIVSIGITNGARRFVSLSSDFSWKNCLEVTQNMSRNRVFTINGTHGCVPCSCGRSRPICCKLMPAV